MYILSTNDESLRRKTCKRCGGTKNQTEFARDPSRKDGRDYTCKDCRAKAQRERYHADPDKARKQKKTDRLKNREKKRAYRQAVTDILNSIKELDRCEITDVRIDLVFHHINPDTRRFKMSRAHGYSWRLILEELLKCVIVTRRMHGMIHSALYGKSIKNPIPEFSAFMFKYYGLVPKFVGKSATYFRPSEYKTAA